MPRFLLPIILLCFVSLVGFGFVVLNLSPDQTISVILFLVTFFLSILSVFSVLLFFVHKKFFFKPKSFTAFGPLVTDDDLRLLFRTSLRRAALISAVVASSAVLKLFGYLSWQTVAAAAISAAALEIYFRRKY